MVPAQEVRIIQSIEDPVSFLISGELFLRDLRFINDTRGVKGREAKSKR